MAIKERFKARRLKAYRREPSADILIHKFHKISAKSVRDIDEGIDKLTILKKRSQRLAQSQQALLSKCEKSLKQSTRLANLS